MAEIRKHNPATNAIAAAVRAAAGETIRPVPPGSQADPYAAGEQVTHEDAQQPSVAGSPLIGVLPPEMVNLLRQADR